MKPIHFGIAISILSISYLQPCRAEEPNKTADPPVEFPKQLSLREARDIAFALNWDLLAAKSNIDQATAQRIIATERPNPSISWNTSSINVDGKPNSTAKPIGSRQQALQDLAAAGGEPIAAVPGRRNGLWSRSYDTVLAINQVIEVGGKRRARIASAQAGIEVAEAQFKDAQRMLDTAVIKGYLAVLVAEANARILNDSAESMRKEASLAEVREKAGDISVTDRNQIEIQADRFEADAKSALSAAADARISLQTLLGNPDPNADWVATDSLDALAALPAPEVPGVEVKRPDLMAAEAALDKAEADLLGQRKKRIPDPTLSLSYEHNPPDGPNSIGVGVSVEVPLWHRYKGEIQSAEVARSDALRDIQKVRAQILADQHQAANAYSTALRRWRDFKDLLYPKSAQIRDNIAFAYEKGGATLLDILTAQRDQNDVRLGMVQAAADTLGGLAELANAYGVALKTESEQTK